MTNEQEFKDAKDGICDYCVDKLYELWTKNGKQEGEGGTTTGIYVRPETLVTDVGDDSTENDTAEFNSIIEKLFYLVDCRHVGSGIWYTDYEKTPEYMEYCDAGYEIVKDYISESLWEDFCRDYVWGKEEQ